MTSDNIQKWQAQKIADGLFPGMNYLLRLRERMEKAGFPPGDKLYQCVCEAYDAMHKLSAKVHSMTCSGDGDPFVLGFDPPSKEA